MTIEYKPYFNKNIETESEEFKRELTEILTLIFLYLLYREIKKRKNGFSF